MLTAETLEGVWALVTTPWGRMYRFDEEAVHHDAAVNPNVQCHLRVQRPYVSCRGEDVTTARDWAKEDFPDLLDL